MYGSLVLLCVVGLVRCDSAINLTVNGSILLCLSKACMQTAENCNDLYVPMVSFTPATTLSTVLEVSPVIKVY